MKTRSNTQKPYFKLDEAGYLIFAPSGKYGATYFVPSDEVRDRIAKRYETIAAFSILPMGLKSIVGLLLLHCKQHGYFEAAAIFLGMGAACFASSVIIRKETSRLVLATPEPALFQKCLLLSESTSSCKLWMWQIVATAWIILLLWIVRYFHVADLEGYLVFSALIAPAPVTVAFCSYLLQLKDRSAKVCV